MAKKINGKKEKSKAKTSLQQRQLLRIVQLLQILEDGIKSPLLEKHELNCTVYMLTYMVDSCMKTATATQAKKLRHRQRSKARAKLCDESFSDISDEDDEATSSDSSESSSDILPRGPHEKDREGDGAGGSAGIAA